MLPKELQKDFNDIFMNYPVKRRKQKSPSKRAKEKPTSAD